jgi:thioredoxin-dependent peroxiredoxin
MALQPGDKAPDFTVNDQDGNPVKLSELKGKKVVLYFYPKDMTPGCTAEACNLRDNYRLMQKQGYEVLGVSTDNEKLHRKFIEKEKLPFRLLSDTNKVLHGSYGTWVEKSMYGRSYMGTARVTFVIDENGVIEEVIGKVDTKNHAAQILKIGGDKNTGVVVEKISSSKKTPAKKTVRTAAKVKKGSKTTGAPKKTTRLAKKSVKKKR